MTTENESTPAAAAKQPIILYGHAGCPMVGPVRRQLEGVAAPFVYVNIHQDDEARGRVRQINNGNESVPTLVFPDGSTLTEPSRRALAERLREQGYGGTADEAPRPRGLAALRADPILLGILIFAIGMVLYGIFLAVR